MKQMSDEAGILGIKAGEEFRDSVRWMTRIIQDSILLYEL
jgi:hypothetical protein